MIPGTMTSIPRTPQRYLHELASSFPYRLDVAGFGRLDAMGGGARLAEFRDWVLRSEYGGRAIDGWRAAISDPGGHERDLLRLLVDGGGSGTKGARRDATQKPRKAV